MEKTISELSEDWEKVYDENMKTYIKDVKKEVFYRKVPKAKVKEYQYVSLESFRKEYIKFISHFNNDNTCRDY
jgi:hypothetical protein